MYSQRVNRPASSALGLGLAVYSAPDRTQEECLDICPLLHWTNHARGFLGEKFLQEAETLACWGCPQAEESLRDA